VTAALWGNILSWLLPSESQQPLSVSIDTSQDGTATVTADTASGTGADWAMVHPTRARVIAPDGTTRDVDLAPSGPGRYQARIPTAAPGAYVAEVTQDVGDGADLTGESGWVAPYPAEFRQVGVDRAFLEQIAAAGGGQVLDDPRQIVRPADHPTAARWPAWPFLVILAGALWPLEIASRRFAPPAPTLLKTRVRVGQQDVGRRVSEPESATADRLLAAARSRRSRTTGR
jgi:Ca-activated chloride channel family protein